MSEVAVAKLKSVELLSDKRPCLVDDTGLFVERFDGFPGALVGPILRKGGIQLLQRLLIHEGGAAPLKAKLVTAVAMGLRDRVITATAELAGVLDFKLVSNPAALDCTEVFVPDGAIRSLAAQERDRGALAFVHRDHAVKSLAAQLIAYMSTTCEGELA